MEKQYVSVSLTVYCRLGCINKLNPSWSILVCVPVVLYVRGYGVASDVRC